ncbi:MAG: DUF2905 domain-containing protein [Firmicutes bacterium]|nr:DUF2905 domain-containing protein [Bacillota bacterium]
MGGLGRMLIFLGLVILAMGLVLLVVDRLPGIPRLPGDILVRRGNFTFYFPLATSLVLSVLLTLLLHLFRR